MSKNSPRLAQRKSPHVTAANFSPGREGAQPDTVVIHDMEGAYGWAIAFFLEPTTLASAHFDVKAGEISQQVSLDDTAWLQRFMPRRPRSIWSRINREKALALIANGQMNQAGLVEIERAKKDGRWEAAYDSPSGATVPPDFEEELERHPKGKEFFKSISAANRYAIIWRLQTAKKAETRAKRMRLFIEMLEKGETLH